MMNETEFYTIIWLRIVDELLFATTDHIHINMAGLAEECQAMGFNFNKKKFLSLQEERSIRVEDREFELLFYRGKLGPCNH